MAKSINYVESRELKEIATELKKRCCEIIGYIDLGKIFFAFVGGEYPDWFECEIQGLKNEWVKYTMQSPMEDAKVYCIALTYDYYEKIQGTQLQWIVLDLLYSCSPAMNGKLRSRDVREFKMILNTLSEFDVNYDWRKTQHLPDLLGEEQIIFAPEEEEDDFIQ